jgi:hypothetical protein
MADPYDPVGEDMDVLAAVVALDAAISAAAARAGTVPVTTIIAWVTRNGDKIETVGSFLAGDTTDETLRFACDAICDDACDLPMPGGPVH